MEKQKQNSCGFGRRKTRFGENDSNIDKFYQPGAANSSHLNPNRCILGNSLQQFGKKKFIQNAFKSFKQTKGSFTRWCKSKGYPKVTTACIKRGKRSPRLKIRRKAVFAQNIRSKKRVYSFGKKIKDTLVNVNSDIIYLKRK